MQRHAGRLLKDSMPRIGECGCRRRAGVEDVTVHRGQDGQAYTKGLRRCGSVHSCTVCAARIASARRVEAITALSSWRAEGGTISMLTLTLPHNRWQSLDQVLGALRKCAKYLNSGRGALKTLLANFGYIGQVRSQEVTHGLSGWHPHLHVLIFTKDDVPEEVQDAIKARWEAAAISSGWASPDWRVGAHWQDGRKAADYVNKQGTWGMAEEVTMTSSKKATGGRTPFQLLEDAALGDSQASALFVEYSETVKGTRQQFWSAGLKKRFAIAEKTDEEIVDAEDTDTEDIEHQDEQIAVIPADSWFLVVRYEERAEVLRAAELGGQMLVDYLCSTLHRRWLADQTRKLANQHKAA